MEPEEYNEYGEIKPVYKKTDLSDIHRIHTTKDIIVGDCWACQKALEQGIDSYWGDNDWNDEEETQ